MGANSSILQWSCESCKQLNPTEKRNCLKCYSAYTKLKKKKIALNKLGTFWSIVVPNCTDESLNQNRHVKEGDSITMDIPFDAYPDPDVIWYCNGTILNESGRIHQTTPSKTKTSLTVLDVKRRDGGTYTVHVDNDYGGFSMSIEVRVIGPPGPPRKLQEKAVNKDSITISWEPPLDNGGQEVAKYVIEKAGQSKVSWSMVDETDQLEYTALKLLEGKKYNFRVAGVNDMGTGDFAETSQPSVPKNPFSRPGKMDAPTVTDVWKDHCTISWKKPEKLGGSPVIAYTVKRSEAGSDKWMTVKCLREPDIALNFTDTRVVEGTEYQYRVFCQNKTGLGPTSDSSETIKAADPLIKPKFAESDMKSTITVKGGSTINLSIPFISNPQPNTAWFYNDKPVSSNQNDEKITLETGNNLTCLKMIKVNRNDSGLYKVELENEYGKCSFEMDITILDPPGRPAAPPKVTNITQNSCTVQWLAPAEDGGSPLLGYYVLRAMKGSSRLKKLNSYPVGTTNLADNSLVPGKEYRYMVSALNQMGTGPTSHFSEVIVAEGVQALKKSSMQIDSARLQWPSVPHIKLARQSSMSVEDVRCREEKRALVKWNSIRAMCKSRNVLFTDLSFPTEAASLYYDTEGPKKTKEDATWLRPSEIKLCKDDAKLPWVVVRKPTPSDIVQGQLGDCWFLSCLAVIADRPDIIEKVLTAREYCPEGVYIATLCKDGAWTTIIIDDLIPCHKKGIILYTRARRRQLWVPLLEKAFSKVYGCYEAIVAGSILEGLTTLTGAPCEIVDLNVTKQKDIDEVWRELMNARKNKYLMGGACGGYKVENDAFLKMGIIFNHAYSILDIQEADGVRLVQLRNPWGSFSWKGDYSDKSQLWSKISAENTAKLNPKLNDEGIFWMPLYELIRYYEWVDICKYRPDWMETRVAGSFSCSYEGRVRISVVEVFEPTEVDLGLFQESNRAQSFGARNCLDLFIAVFEGDYHETGKLGSVVCHSKREIEKSISFPTMLDSGIYTVVCMAFNHLAREQLINPVKYMFVMHSSKCIVRESHKMPAEVIADSLIRLALEKGKLRNEYASKGTSVFFLAQGWLGAIIIAENKNPTENMHVTCDCTKSLNVVSTRGELKTVDVVPPMHRQVITVLTPPDKSKFGPGLNFSQKTSASGEIEESPGMSHSPAFPKGLEPLYSARPIVD